MKDRLKLIRLYNPNIKRSFLLKYNTQKRRKKDPWTLMEDLTVTLTNGDVITVPKGMATDLKSSPRFLWGLFSPYGPFMMAIMIHDYLYRYDYKLEEWGQKKARKFADKEMLYWTCYLQPGIYSVGNYMSYWAVRLFGGPVFKKTKNGR